MIISRFPQYLKRAIFEFSGTSALVLEGAIIDGAAYNVYRLTDSGVLTVGVGTKVWMCGAGGGGGKASRSDAGFYCGGGGGGGYVASDILAQGEYAVTIGAGGGSGKNGGITQITKNSETIISADGGICGNTGDKGNGGAGGSGGGGGANDTVSAILRPGGTGGGVTTRPFALSELNPHSAGGGSGIVGGSWNAGGATGGSDGGNGQDCQRSIVSNTDQYKNGAAGGNYGGGKGGKGGDYAGGNATYYGSAGGGASITNDYSSKNGGTGYQGCMYVAIPA